MPSLLLHLTALERLSIDGRGMPAELARALSEDIEYARLGVLLPDLPHFEGLRGSLESVWPSRQRSAFARVFHEKAPVAMGLKMAELVSNGALVGREAGLAFIAGYFTHLCLDRVFDPVVAAVTRAHPELGRDDAAIRRRVDWIHGALYLRDFYGQDLLGEPALGSKLQVVKRRGLPTRGVGRGLFELIRVAAHESIQAAPTKPQVDSWIRGLYLYGAVLSGPLGRTRRVDTGPTLRADLYRGPEVDVPGEVDRALNNAREVLSRVWRLIRRGGFTPRAKAQFLASFPEVAIQACAA